MAGFLPSSSQDLPKGRDCPHLQARDIFQDVLSASQLQEALSLEWVKEATVPGCRGRCDSGEGQGTHGPSPNLAPSNLNWIYEGVAGRRCRPNQCSPTAEAQGSPTSVVIFKLLHHHVWSSVCTRGLSCAYPDTYSLNEPRHSLLAGPRAHAGQAVCPLMLGCTHTNHIVLRLGWAMSRTPSQDWTEIILMFTPSLEHTGIHTLT